MSAQTLDIAAAAQAKEIVSYNPATGEEVGRAALASAKDVTEAVARARQAQGAWAQKSYRGRGRLVMRPRRIVLDELEEIALLISRETGKPVAEAISMELTPTPDLKRFFPSQTKHLFRPE